MFRGGDTFKIAERMDTVATYAATGAVASLNSSMTMMDRLISHDAASYGTLDDLRVILDGFRDKLENLQAGKVKILFQGFEGACRRDGIC